MPGAGSWPASVAARSWRRPIDHSAWPRLTASTWGRSRSSSQRRRRPHRRSPSRTAHQRPGPAPASSEQAVAWSGTPPARGCRPPGSVAGQRSSPRAGTAPDRSGMPAGASVGQEHPDLAVLDPPGRPGVLTLHPGRLGALLEEPGLVHHQHPTRVAQVLYDIAAQVSTDLVGIPTSMVEQPLHPVRGVLTGVLGQPPTILAFHPCQQTTQERSCPTADLDPAEPRRDPLAQRRQLARPLLHLRHPGLHLLTPLLHPATAKRAGYPRKVRL